MLLHLLFVTLILNSIFITKSKIFYQELQKTIQYSQIFLDSDLTESFSPFADIMGLNYKFNPRIFSLLISSLCMLLEHVVAFHTDCTNVATQTLFVKNKKKPTHLFCQIGTSTQKYFSLTLKAVKASLSDYITSKGLSNQRCGSKKRS